MPTGSIAEILEPVQDAQESTARQTASFGDIESPAEESTKGSANFGDISKAADIVKEAATTSLPQALSNVLGKYGPGKVTSVAQHYENAKVGTRDLIGRALGHQTLPDLESVYGIKMVEHALDAIGKGLAGTADFLTTPAGVGTVATAGAVPPVVSGGIRSVFAGKAAAEAVPAVKEAIQHPSQETVGTAAGEVANAAAPVLPELAAAASKVSVPNLYAKIDAHNVEAARLLEQERATGWEKAPKVGQAESIPIKIGDKEFKISAAGQSSQGRPFYQVKDANGRVINAGYGENVQGFLRKQGAKPAGGDFAAAEGEPAPVVTPEVVSSLVRRRVITQEEGQHILDNPDELTPNEHEQVVKAARLAEATPRKYSENAPTGPRAQAPAAERAPEASIPEEGAPERVARVQDARERLSQKLTGKAWAEASNPERLVIDEFVTQGHGFSVEPPSDQEYEQALSEPGQPKIPSGVSPPSAEAAVAPAPPLPTAVPPAVKTVKLYRGTREEGEGNKVGNGIFYAADKKAAESYGGTIAEKDITFQNLLEAETWQDAKTKLGLPRSTTMPELIEAAKSAGHDGITFKTPTNGQEYIHIPAVVPIAPAAQSPSIPETGLKPVGGAIEPGGAPTENATDVIRPGTNPKDEPMLAPAANEGEKQAVAEPERKFSSTQVEIPADVAAPIRAFGETIPKGELAEDGLEDKHHITVKYGVHEEVPQADVAKVLKGEGPITATLGKMSVFSNPDADVLKIDVSSPDLHRLNSKIAEGVPVTDTHPDYKPHVTIAYLKPGEGKKYVGQDLPGVTGQTVTFNGVTFSPKDGEKSQIELSKPEQPTKLAKAAKVAAHPLMPRMSIADGRVVDQNGGTVAILDEDGNVELAPPYSELPGSTQRTLKSVAQRTIEQDAKRNERGAGVPEPRRPSAPIRYGGTTQIRVPGENRAFDASYSIRELSDVVPSHNPFTLQANPDYPFRNDRNYEDRRNAERIIKQVAEFDPEYVASESPTAGDGAPIIDKNGNVLGGNSRTMTIARVYKQRPDLASAYKKLLTKKAAQFGLTEDDVKAMKQPVLVRELSRELPPEEVQPTITDLNKVGTASLSASERAIADSGRVSPETLDQLAGMIDNQGPAGTLSEALSGKAGPYIVDRLIKDGVITTQEKPNLFDNNGVLTASAKERIGKLMLGRVFEDSAQFENAPPAMRNKLERIVAPLSRTAGKPDWDLLPDVREAVKMLEEARAVGAKNLDDLVAQQGLFSSGGYSPRTVELAKAISQTGPVKLAQAFNRYANDSRGPTMFGEVTPQEAFTDAFGEAPHGERGSGSLSALSFGLSDLVEQDIIPTLKDAASGLAEAKDSIQSTLLPTSRGPQAKQGGLIMRQRLAEFARRMNQAQAAVAEADKLFEKKGDAFGKDFILQYFGDEMAPLPQFGNPDLDKIATTIREMLDKSRDQVQHLGTGKLKDYYVNYFGRVFKDWRKADSIFAAYFGRRPLEGGKTFLKQRKYPSWQDALDAGLEPVTWNPIRLMMLKISEMERYAMAHTVLNDWKASGLAKFVDARSGQKPARWRKIDDPIGVVYGPSIQHISEYPNEGIYTALTETAKALGIPHERGFLNLGNAIGRARKGGGIKTLHGTAEDVLAHEIGHQIDWLAGSGNRFMKYGNAQTAATIKQARVDLASPSSSAAAKTAARQTLKTFKSAIQHQVTLNKELRALADLRAGDKAYTHKREEKMALLAEMWVGARDLFEKTAPTVFAEWKRFLGDNQKLHKLRDIQGNTEVTQISQPYDVGGLVIKGNWYAPEGAARILNNYLSPGLRQHAAYKALFGLNNVINQFQLGLSAFHVGFTSADAAVSKAALGIESMLRGHPLTAAKHFAGVATAPFTTAWQGDKVLKEWYTQNSQGQAIGDIVKALEMAGGRARMDEVYGTAMADRMRHAFRNGNFWGGLARVPFATVEKISDLIMRELVPRQKLGVFADLARFEMERLGPNATYDEVRDAMAKVWDSVDNRMGQMVYDNLFWNRIAKDTAMLTVRSVGWNLGTLREVGGGAIDALRIPIQIAGGKPPKDVNIHKISYLIGLALVGAVFGAMYQYLATGEGPQELKDYYFPKTGQLDEAGRPQRVSPPMYTKDIYHYTTEPGRTLSNKIAPIWSLFAEMIHNRDFYGNEIRNSEDPIVEQMLQMLQYGATEITPFGIRNFQKEVKLGGTPLEKAQQFIGITQAPSSLEKTEAERLASEIQSSEQRSGGRGHQAAARYEAKRAIAHLAASGREYGEAARDYISSGVLTAKDVREAAARRAIPPLVRSFRSLDARDALRVWKVADPEERKELRPLMVKKFSNVLVLPPAQREVLVPQFREALAR